MPEARFRASRTTRFADRGLGLSDKAIAEPSVDESLRGGRTCPFWQTVNWNTHGGLRWRMLSGEDASSPRRPPLHPTSIILHGSSKALLDWVALAIASASEEGYRWTDVRRPGDAPDPLGPLARGAVPEDRLHVRDPSELKLDDVAANAGITAGVRSVGEPTELSRVADRLRLPPATRHLLEARRPDSPPFVVVVSNAQRLVAHFSSETVRPVLRTLVAHGLVLLASFADVARPDRFVFENVWRLTATELPSWEDARLEVEQATVSGPLPQRGTTRLGEVPIVASFLATALQPVS